MGSVNLEAIERLAQRAPTPRQAAPATTIPGDLLTAALNDLRALGIDAGEFRPGKDGAQRPSLTGCPYSGDHVDGPCLIRYADGGVNVHCPHDRCQGKTIRSAPGQFPRTGEAISRQKGAGPTLTTGNGGPPGALPDAAPAILQTRRAADIEPREIEWLWKPWLPAGMLALFAGYGGGGKSTVALSIAAACSTGGRLPDGQSAPALDTLIFAAEDSPEHTIRPRLAAMGANLNRIHLVDGIPQAGGDPGWVQLRAHVAMIELTVRKLGIGLVILDPVSSYIGDANSDKESDVRAALSPLVKMAERTGCAVLMIRHVSKAGDGARAASRILGSTAWHDLPRVAWMLADAPDEHQPEPREDGTRDTRRVLGVVKTNLAAKPQARWFLQPADGPMRWIPDGSPVTIDECFYAPSDRGGKVRDAEEWLRERLAGGSQQTRAIEAAAKDAGISLPALKRARASLNVRRHKESSGAWAMSLPPRLIPPAPGPNGASDDTGHEIEVNALHNTGEPKASTVNALNPFPASRGNLALLDDPGLVADDPGKSKAFNLPLIGELNALHNEPLPPTGTDGPWREEI